MSQNEFPRLYGTELYSFYPVWESDTNLYFTNVHYYKYYGVPTCAPPPPPLTYKDHCAKLHKQRKGVMIPCTAK